MHPREVDDEQGGTDEGSEGPDPKNVHAKCPVTGSHALICVLGLDFVGPDRLVMERMNGPDSTTGRKPEARNLSETQLITKKEHASTAGLFK
ncbi:hypothetical protein EYF80_035773 [Liparis tanakae]|uniref:Uncharacterized protein n=1 Tax=Liparis tanakae TaxID=230148 RepID=A0A4Z2GL72_9TELE|nr:hypothetical protein EYF80_035773 [Liparis tanakae]